MARRTRLRLRTASRSGLIGDFHIEALLELLFEQLAFLVPDIAGISAVAGLGQLHDVHRLDVGEQLVHLLLAVARGFAQDHVAEVGEGTFVGERENHRCP